MSDVLVKAGTCVWHIPTRYWEGDPLVELQLVEDWCVRQAFVYALHPDEDNPSYYGIFQRVFLDREDAAMCRTGLTLLREADIGSQTTLILSRINLNRSEEQQ